MALDPPNTNDYYNVGKEEAIIRQPGLTIDDGDVSDFTISAGAAMADFSSTYAEGQFRTLWLDTATGDDLTAYASDHGVERGAKNAATGEFVFSRPTFTAGSGTILAGTTCYTDPDPSTGTVYQYTSDSPVTFGATDLSVTILATAVVQGSASSVAANSVTNISNTLFDSTITVNNPNPFAGGSDGQTDESLRNSVRNLPGTSSRATSPALQYWSEQVAGVASANVVEELDSFDGEQTGITDVYVVDQNGNSSPTLNSQVKAALQVVKAAGQIVNVVGGVLVNLPPFSIQLTLRYASGISVQQIQDDVKSAVVDRINSLDVGSALNQDIIKQAVFNVDQANILAIAITGLPSIFAVDNDQIIKTTTANITVQ